MNTPANISTLQQAIFAKKAALAEAISAPLSALAEQCVAAWPDADALDAAMAERIADIPNCRLLYCWNRQGIEISSMVHPGGVESSWRGRDLSDRPYLTGNLPFKGVMLSSVYLSQFGAPEQTITALQAVNRSETLLGFIAADFLVDDLLRDAQLAAPPLHWRQFRGDPSVRSTLFMQTRTQSVFDTQIDSVLSRISRLMRRHGVFHCKIHFSSSRCSFWLMDDPYNYRLHSVDEIIDPELCLAYPLRAYPEHAAITEKMIDEVMHQFKLLRFADETIYLRAGSLNLMNGIVGLTFSCDGSHYMPAREFLEKKLAFWLGTDTAA